MERLSATVISWTPWSVCLVYKWGHEKACHKGWKGWKTIFYQKILMEAATSPLAHTILISVCKAGDVQGLLKLSWQMWKTQVLLSSDCYNGQLHWRAENTSDILHLAYFTATQIWLMVVRVPASQKVKEWGIVRSQETFCLNCWERRNLFLLSWVAW